RAPMSIGGKAFPDMKETFLNIFFLMSRYIHIVATTVIVGGTLFFELVVPLAIGELKTEVQLALYGRMRLGFCWVIYICVLALIVTGSVSLYRNREVINGEFIKFLNTATKDRPEAQQKIQQMQDSSIWNRPTGWFIAHLVSGLLAALIAVLLVS